MKLHFETCEGLSIQSYNENGITIGNILYTTPVIITSTAVIDHWSPPPISQLTLESIEIAISKNLEVLILGTGKHLTFPPPLLIAQLAAYRIGLETMNTSAACRTYNILHSEGRHVAAALLRPS